MVVRLHPHARARIEERGVTENEVRATVERGEQFPAKFGRIGFRRNFLSTSLWRGKRYSNKQIEVYAVPEGSDWLVITVIARFF